MSRASRIPLLCALLTVYAGPVVATERFERRFDVRDGLPAAEVSALAQDSHGFIWVGTYGGLVRYDGSEMRLWGHDALSGEVRFIVEGPGPELLVGDGRRLFRVVPGGLEPVADPSSGNVENIVDAAFDRSGTLWIIRGGKLLRRQGGAWVVPAVATLESERARQLRRVEDGRFFALTDAGVWELHESHATKRFALTRPRGLIAAADGALVTFAVEESSVVAFRGGRLERSFRYTGRPIALARRGDTIWVACDASLTALTRGEPPRVTGVQHGLISGGPLLVDREQGLWLGTFRGLVHYSEPEVRIWTEADGLTQRGAFFLAGTTHHLWVAGFGGTTRLDRSGTKSDSFARVFGPLCPDEHERVWTGTPTGILPVTEYRGGESVAVSACAIAPGGTLWLTAEDRLFSKRRGDTTFSTVASPRFDERVAVVREDSGGRLWLAAGERVCHALVERLHAGAPAVWSCQTVEGVRHIFDLREVGSDRLWMATRMGVFHRGASGGEWLLVPGSRSLSSSIVHRLVPSPSGGVWVIGEGLPLRVIDRPHSPDGWEIAERLTAWQGIPIGGSRDLLEDSDGALWLATLAGVVRIPNDVRRMSLPAPAVEVVNVALDGRVFDGSMPAALEHRNSLVEIRFAALSYRARGLLRYQVRHRQDAPWTDLLETTPALRYVNLPYGRYHVEVRASLDGRNWSPAPAGFAFEVRRPWYFQAWALALFAAAAVAAAYAAHRIRMAFVLRMERQRLRIAMDLHDEVGSGLGSIGLLASLAADERLDEEKRRNVAAEIAEMAAEVGATLGDLVWALRVRGETLEGLAYYLVERAGRLFPHAQPALVTEFPEPWPAVALSPAVRQSLLMIGLEALHNAARHASATRVVLALKPAGHRWRLSVSDDGVGLLRNRPLEECGGTGMFSMHRRAEAIGATIRFVPNGPRGTTVELVFDPQAREQTSVRRLAAGV
jgi:signal transduction histidine kinase